MARKPRVLPAVAAARVSSQPRVPMPTREPAATIRMSLGDGGKRFSTKAMRNTETRTQTGFRPNTY